MPTDTRIFIQGCEEATEVSLSLTADELATVERLAAASKAASPDRCHPVIEVQA